MGIFSRMNRVIKSNLNALIDKAEDPEKLIGQTVIDMKAELRTARKELVQTLGTAKRLLKKAQEHEGEAARWEDKAVVALQQGDEPLAREALRRKAREESQAEDATRQARDAESAADEMKGALDRIERKIDEVENRKSTLAAQVRRAREEPGHTPAGGSRYGSETFDELDRMAGRIDQLEAEVEAANVLDDPKRAEVDAKFRRLEKDRGADQVEDQLAALKKKLEG